MVFGGAIRFVIGLWRRLNGVQNSDPGFFSVSARSSLGDFENTTSLLGQGLRITDDPYRLVGLTLSEKYRLDRYAGGGGMGAVYKASEVDTGRSVAVKILKPDILVRNPLYAALFRQEAEAARRLDHPNIVKVMDSGRHENLSFMVMEWLDGRTLEDVLSQEQMSLNRIVRIFRQICSAFAAAHSMNIIHLDIKPANIFLLNDEGSSELVKVIDFGLARILSSDSGTTVTRFLGTYQYCSPEHFGGKVTYRSDIYSLGATLYHMIAGVLPFGASYINAKMHPNLDFPAIPSAAKMRPDIPQSVEQVLTRALSRRPVDRQQSAKELFQEFWRSVNASAGLDERTSDHGENDASGAATNAFDLGPELGSFSRRGAASPRFGVQPSEIIMALVAFPLSVALGLFVHRHLYQNEPSSNPIPAGSAAESQSAISPTERPQQDRKEEQPTGEHPADGRNSSPNNNATQGFGGQTIVLRPAGVRGVSTSSVINIGPNTHYVRLRVLLSDGASGYERYQAVIHGSFDSQGVWAARSLRPGSTPLGQAILLNVPGAVLRAGEYEIVLRGYTAMGDALLSSSYTFRVVRP
jgi:serine/threonine protein kinase